MQIDQLTTAVRPRSGWEAMDLGLRLLQQHASAVYRPWFIVLLPLTILLLLVCWVHPMWAALALWWLKPLLGRLVLVVLGAAVFGSTPNTLTTLKQWWRLAWRDSWRLLTIGRLHPNRSFRLPVRQLEQLSGSARNKRLITLSDESATGPLWLSSLMIEWAIALLLISLSFMVFGYWLDNTDLQWEAGDIWAGAAFTYIWFGNLPFIELWQMRLLVILYAVRISIIEPFFNAAGFGLYLNRRTVLEGWDIELQFRRIAARLAAVGKTAGLVLVVATLSLTTPTTSVAETSVNTSQEAASDQELAYEPGTEQSDEAISAIRSEADKCSEFDADVQRLANSDNPASEMLATLLTSDDWKPCELATFRRWNNTDEPAADSDWNFELPLLGALLKPLVWALAIGGLLLLLLQAWRWRGSLNSAGIGGLASRRQQAETQRSKITLPQQVTGSVLQNAQALWQAGQHREALSLLYRGALQQLDSRWQLELEDSFTEAECQRHIGEKSRTESLPEVGRWFSRLTLSWQRLAWGHRPPSDSEFSELTQGWAEHIDGRKHAPNDAPRQTRAND